MLDFTPKTMEENKSRYAKAIENIVSVAQMESGPGISEDNVFDFSDGMRIIISKDELEGEEKIHCSASFIPGSAIAEHVEVLGVGGIQWFLGKATQRIAEVSGGVKLKFHGLSPKMIPHWFEE